MVEYAAQVMASRRYAGLAVGLAQPGHPDRFWTFGHRDVEQGLPVTTNTIFGAASLTKSMTAVAILQLQERGLLSVQDPVVRYLPELRTPGITLHHLLTHTAGFPPLPTLGKVLAREICTAADLLEYLAGLEYERLGPPGAVFNYTNEATALLGAVVERVSGMAYREYIAERLFWPAGMTASRFDPPGEGEVTLLYHPGDDGPVPAGPFSDSGPLTPARGLCTTVQDALRYTELYRTGGTVGGVRLLREESVRAMTHPWVREPDGSCYGYCLMLTPGYPGGSLVEHVGASRGVSAFFSVVPAAGVAAVALFNTGGAPAGRVTLAAVSEALGASPAPAPQPSAAVGNLAEFAGHYGGTDGFPLVVRVVATGTHLEFEGDNGVLLPVGPDRFLYREHETEMSATFLRDASGGIEALFFGLRHLRKIS